MRALDAIAREGAHRLLAAALEAEVAAALELPGASATTTGTPWSCATATPGSGGRDRRWCGGGVGSPGERPQGRRQRRADALPQLHPAALRSPVAGGHRGAAAAVPSWAAAHGETSKARAIALDVARRAEESGAYAIALWALHDVARLGDVRAAAAWLGRLALIVEGPLAPAVAAHVEALEARDGPGLDRTSSLFEAMGATLLAAEAAAIHRGEGRKASMRAWSVHAHRRLEGCEEIADRLVVSGGEPYAAKLRRDPVE